MNLVHCHRNSRNVPRTKRRLERTAALANYGSKELTSSTSLKVSTPITLTTTPFVENTKSPNTTVRLSAETSVVLLSRRVTRHVCRTANFGVFAVLVVFAALVAFATPIALHIRYLRHMTFSGARQQRVRRSFNRGMPPESVKRLQRHAEMSSRENGLHEAKRRRRVRTVHYGALFLARVGRGVELRKTLA